MKNGVGGAIQAAARDYLGRGWSVIPIGGGKRPPRGFKYREFFRRQPSAVEVDAWFGRPDVVGVAIILGDVSGGLAVRDFDQAGAYERWATEHSELATSLPTVRTGRGWHVYFTATGQRFRRFSDGELRAGDNYVVAPPSQHPDGGTYRWVVGLPSGPLATVNPIDAGMCATGTAETASVTSHGSGALSGSVASWASGSVALEDLLVRTQPKAVGQREAKLFEFARGLKFNVEGVDSDPRRHRHIVERWHRMALPVIGTKPFDDSWMDYLRAAERARVPLGVCVPEDVMERARAGAPPRCANEWERPELRLLVALCRELQRECGHDAFALSCHVAGRLLGVAPKQASRWLNGLERAGVLACTKRAKPGPAGSKASRWRYLPPIDA